MTSEGPRVAAGVRYLTFAERLVSVAALVSVAGIMMAQVVARYFLDTPIVWSEEFARFGLIWLTFIGAAFVMAEDSHIQVDLFSGRLGPLGQGILRILSAASVLAAVGMLLPPGVEFLAARAGTTSPMMGMPMGVWYASVPLGLALAAFHSLVNIVSGVKRARGTNGEAPDADESDDGGGQ